MNFEGGPIAVEYRIKAEEGFDSQSGWLRAFLPQSLDELLDLVCVSRIWLNF